MKIKEFCSKVGLCESLGKKLKIYFSVDKNDFEEGVLDVVWEGGITLNEDTPKRVATILENIEDIEIVEVQND